MNCKPGDLAVIVRGLHAENIGAIVEVLRAAEMCEHVLPENGITYAQGHGFRWVIRSIGRPLTHSNNWPNSKFHVARDVALRPIRPNDGEDETLQWAGKPQEVTA